MPSLYPHAPFTHNPTNPFSLSPTISIPRPIKPAPFHHLSPSMPFTSIPSCPKLPNTHACCHLFSLYTLSYTHFCSCPSYPFSTMHENHSSITVFIPIIPFIQSHGSLPVYTCKDHTPMDSPHSDAKPFFLVTFSFQTSSHSLSYACNLRDATSISSRLFPLLVFYSL